MGRYTWILDPGHGENTPGKRGPGDPPVVLEYEFNRAIANRVVGMLSYMDSEILITNPGPADMGKKQRAAYAQYKQKQNGNVVFVSIHGNAAGNGNHFSKAHGAVVFHRGNDRGGRKLAEVMLDCLGETALDTARGIKKAGFFVLVKTKNIPSILVECGFMTNEGDSVVMSSPEGRDMIARAFVKMINHFEQHGGL